MSGKGKQGGKTIDILFITREYDGLAGAGGVKDVCRQLAETLAREGKHRVRVILPRYGFMDAQALGFQPLVLSGCPLHAGTQRTVFTVDMHYSDRERREAVSIWHNERGGVTLYLVEAERYAEKLAVYTYTAEEQRRDLWKQAGSGHFDYFAMNILLQKSALDLMLLLGSPPDVIHCHDGHAATLAAIAREHPGYRHFFRCSGLVVTIHNAGQGYHQEVGDLPFAKAITGLPANVIASSLLDGSFDPFLAAAPYARLNAVSENYARELQQTVEDKRTGGLGHRLLEDKVILAGITNGIDPGHFDPRQPERLGLAAAFSPQNGDFAGKKICKKELLAALSPGNRLGETEKFGFLQEESAQPLFTFIGRLTSQKGVDVLLLALDDLFARDSAFQAVMLGNGNPELEKNLISLTRSSRLAGRLCYLRGFDPILANRIYAAGDFFLIPSLYEPCGLTDYIAQLLGNLPVVRAVGGLVKVIDGVTGFSYHEQMAPSLYEAMERALDTYRNEPDRLNAMRMEAVRRILEYHTWDKVMEQYLVLYDDARRMTPVQ